MIILQEEIGGKRRIIGGGRQERHWALSSLFLFISKYDYHTSFLCSADRASQYIYLSN